MQSHFSATRPETFGKIFEFPVQSLVGPENSGAQMATHLDFFNSFPPKKSERPYLMAGVAVQIVPCSAGFPCQQGILQGILQNRGFGSAGDHE
jgi:hypothetical protein